MTLTALVAVFYVMWLGSLALIALSPVVSVPLWLIVFAAAYALQTTRVMVGLTSDMWRHGLRNDR